MGGWRGIEASRLLLISEHPVRATCQEPSAALVVLWTLSVCVVGVSVFSFFVTGLVVSSTLV